MLACVMPWVRRRSPTPFALQTLTLCARFSHKKEPTHELFVGMSLTCGGGFKEIQKGCRYLSLG